MIHHILKTSKSSIFSIVCFDNEEQRQNYFKDNGIEILSSKQIDKNVYYTVIKDLA